MPQGISWFRFWYDLFRMDYKGYNPFLRNICYMILPSADKHWAEYYLREAGNDNEPKPLS